MFVVRRPWFVVVYKLALVCCFVGCRSWCVVCCVLFGVCWLVFGVCWLLLLVVVGCGLCVAFLLEFVVCCLWIDVRCVLCVVW